MGKGTPPFYHLRELMVVPHLVDEDAVDAHGENLHAQLLKFRMFFSNC